MTINLTDPANHPANGPLTAERIERVRDELQRSIQYQNGGDMAYVIADAIKGLEELLVSKVAASEPVPDEELDQMIWKLERDGMTPKLLSLMRELRERRKADKPTDDERLMAIEGIASPVTQEGWVMVPIEPTEDMIVQGFESEPDESFSDEKEWEEYDAMSGCQKAAHRAELCWNAMIASAPQKVK